MITAWHVFTDILIYILPLFLLKNLTLPRKQKIGVALTFAVGFICIVFANLFQISLLIGSDITVSWLLSALEQTWSLIVVCCPTFRALVTKDIRRVFRRRATTITGTSRSRATGSTGSALNHGSRRPGTDDDKELRGNDSDGDHAGDEEMAVIERSEENVIYKQNQVSYVVESVDTLEQAKNNTGVTTTVHAVGEGGSGPNTQSQSAQPFHFV